MQLASDTVTGDCVAVKFIPLAKGFNAQSVGRELLNQRACAGHDHIVQLRVSCWWHLDAYHPALLYHAVSLVRVHRSPM